MQAAAAQNQKEIAQAVKAKFSELSDRVIGLFKGQKVRIDAIASKVVEEEQAFDS